MLKNASYLTFLAVIGFSSFTYAMPPKPAKCPSVSSIKSVKLSYAKSYSTGYTVVQLSNYNTSDTWAFGFNSIQATSSAEALKIGNEWLSSLSGTPRPMPASDNNIWYCLYTTANGNYGLAITPINSLSSFNQSTLSAIR